MAKREYVTVAEASSRSTPGTIYYVKADVATGMLGCNCPPWIYTKKGEPRKCDHVDAIIDDPAFVAHIRQRQPPQVTLYYVQQLLAGKGTTVPKTIGGDRMVKPVDEAAAAKVREAQRQLAAARLRAQQDREQAVPMRTLREIGQQRVQEAIDRIDLPMPTERLEAWQHLQIAMQRVMRAMVNSDTCIAIIREMEEQGAWTPIEAPEPAVVPAYTRRIIIED